MGGPQLFSSLQCISPETLNVLSSRCFLRTTPVQEATIPLFCGNKDVAVDACTGSGKTLAFVVPVVERLRKLEEPLKAQQVGAVIVSPTRELAKQIFSVAEPFIASVPGLTGMLLVGGTDPSHDVAKFRSHGGHVLVGTPGRLDDMMKRCAAMDLRRLEVLVLDEADRLLDMGFKQQLDSIMARLPKQRRTGLFSATQTEAVEALVRAGLRNPVRINVAVTAAAPPPPAPGSKAAKAAAAAASKGGAPDGTASGGGAVLSQKTPSGLTIQYVTCEADEKVVQLVRFLAAHHTQHKVIVYFMTCALVDYFGLALRRLAPLRSCEVRCLHGKMKQAAREATLEAFARLPAGVLLCTDLAARGLDIPDVHWILQYDPPQDPAAFIHRVGRTARMGRSGNALALLMPSEATYTDFLRLRKVPLAEGSLLEEGPEGAAAGGCAGGVPSAQVLAALRREAERDRDMMDKATRAFVSYVRGYKEHHCKFIFRVQDLSIGRLATSLGLLRLPKMPDLKRPLGMEHFTPSQVDPSTVPYRDKAKEKQRQQLLKQRAEAAQTAEAQAGQKRKKAALQAAAAQSAAVEARLPAAKRRALQQVDEMALLNKEYALLKKLKKGKISARQYDVATGLTSDEEEDGEQQGRPGAASGLQEEGAGAAVRHAAADDDDDEEEEEEGAGGRSEEGAEDGGEAGPSDAGAQAAHAGGQRHERKGSGRGDQGVGGGRASGLGPAGGVSKAHGGHGGKRHVLTHAQQAGGAPGGALSSYLAKKQKRQKRKNKKAGKQGGGASGA